VYPPEAVQQALEQCHEEIFERILEAPLEDGRLWFTTGTWNDACVHQFVRFDGLKKSGGSDGSKDDLPDVIALAYATWGPRATDYQPQDPEEQKRREEEQEAEAALQRKQHFYDRMFSQGGTRLHPAPPQPPAPTWREALDGKAPAPVVENEPQQPIDPRMAVFGNRGPWRL